MPDERYMPDIDNLQTVEEVIAWLRVAAGECRETAKHVIDKEQAAYLRGRAHAFGLAAGLLGDAISKVATWRLTDAAMVYLERTKEVRHEYEK